MQGVWWRRAVLTLVQQADSFQIESGWHEGPGMDCPLPSEAELAKARMLSKSITDSQRFNALPNDSCRLLYLLLIPHADNLGRLRGEPVQVKGLILADNPATVPKIDSWLGELARSGLIRWYIHQNRRFIYIEQWEKHQKLHHTTAMSSELPAPEAGASCIHGESTVSSPLVHGGPTVSSRPEVEVELEGEVEGENELHTSSREDVRVPIETWFEEYFWPKYPRRKNVSKARALAAVREAFRGLSPADEDRLGDAILDGLARFCRDVSGTEERYIVHPERWIRQRRWETAHEPATTH